MNQIAHLQHLAANNSSNNTPLTIGNNSQRKSERNLMQNNYHPTDRQYWTQQQQQAQNYSDIHLRGGMSTDCDVEYSDTELGHRQSALGPFQIMPPQAHSNNRLDCKNSILLFIEFESIII